MELKQITVTLNGVSMLTVASISAQPTRSFIPGLVNNNSGDQVNDPDAVITNTEDEFIAETDIGPNHYLVMTCSHNVGASDMTRRGVVNTKDAVLLSDYVWYPGIPIELTHKRSDTGIRTRQNMMHLKPEPAASASTRLRPISVTRQMPIGQLVFLIRMGYLQCANHVPEMAQLVEAAHAASVESNTNKHNKR